MSGTGSIEWRDTGNQHKHSDGDVQIWATFALTITIGNQKYLGRGNPNPGPKMGTREQKQGPRSNEVPCIAWIPKAVPSRQLSSSSSSAHFSLCSKLLNHPLGAVQREAQLEVVKLKLCNRKWPLVCSSFVPDYIGTLRRSSINILLSLCGRFWVIFSPRSTSASLATAQGVITTPSK